jgi:hypothetical protein
MDGLTLACRIDTSVNLLILLLPRTTKTPRTPPPVSFCRRCYRVWKVLERVVLSQCRRLEAPIS